jgi:alkaline phosphatase D
VCYEAAPFEANFMPTTRRSLLSLALAAALPPAFVPQARAADVERFALGVASGAPRPTSVLLWTRLVGAALPERVEVQWEVAHDEAFVDIAARGVAPAERAFAHSVHVQVEGLAPGRWYWYRFTALGARSRIGRTRTAPAADAMEPLRFAIASCQRWDHGHYAAWRDVAESPLDAVLFLGDYIYEYPTPAGATRVRRHEGGPLRTLDDYRTRYAQYKSDPLLQRAHAHAPWIVVWDDHEVENDYAGAQGQSPPADFAAQRAAAYQAYWEHMPFAPSLRPRGPDLRIFERYDWGRLARIHALDDRQYRDAQACPRPGRGGGSNSVLLRDCPALADPARSLLGATQERWLADGWSTAHGWNLLAQQTLMARLSWRDPQAAPGGMAWTDGWDGYPHARRRLLASAVERRIDNLVVLGGDVHASFVADLKLDFDDARAPVVATEFCGTSISSEGMAQARIDAALPFNPHLRHARGGERGYVRFTLDARELQAELRVVEQPLDAASALHTAARFAVASGRAGAQQA